MIVYYFLLIQKFTYTNISTLLNNLGKPSWCCYGRHVEVHNYLSDALVLIFLLIFYDVTQESSVLSCALKDIHRCASSYLKCCQLTYQKLPKS